MAGIRGMITFSRICGSPALLLSVFSVVVLLFIGSIKISGSVSEFAAYLLVS